MSNFKPSIQELVRVEDRISFLYLEFAALTRYGGSLNVKRRTGNIHIPLAQIGCLWLGPSVTLTHQAMELISECRTTVMWIGDEGLAFYAHGSPLTGSSRLLTAQAVIHTDPAKRLECAKAMYCMRFGEDTPSRTDSIARFRGAEGARVKKIYKLYSDKYKVAWNGRMYTPGAIGKSDTINQALTVAHHCMYAVSSGVIHGLGLHPGLSVVHNGTQDSFVYDVADLYKTEICVPIAFRVARNHPDVTGRKLSSIIRAEMRAELTASRIVPRAVKDIYNLLLGEEVRGEYSTTDHLWDSGGVVGSGINYGDVF